MQEHRSDALIVVWFWSHILYFINKCFPLSHPENKILVTQRPVLRVDNKTATLVCNYTYNGTGKEFRASLHKGTDSAVEVCFVSWNTTKGNNTQSSNGFTCHGYQDDQKKHVIFNLSNMNPNHTDIYFCKIEVMYPPPYVCSDKSNGTIIHVRGKPWNHNCPIFFSFSVHSNARAHSNVRYKMDVSEKTTFFYPRSYTDNLAAFFSMFLSVGHNRWKMAETWVNKLRLGIDFMYLKFSLFSFFKTCPSNNQSFFSLQDTFGLWQQQLEFLLSTV